MEGYEPAVGTPDDAPVKDAARGGNAGSIAGVAAGVAGGRSEGSVTKDLKQVSLYVHVWHTTITAQ